MRKVKTISKIPDEFWDELYPSTIYELIGRQVEGYHKIKNDKGEVEIYEAYLFRCDDDEL